MKKVGLILAVCLLIASCGGKQLETVDSNEITFDTLRVKVLILAGDTLSGTVDASEVELDN